MDEQEFRSILQLFPVVRSRDHRVILSSLFPPSPGKTPLLIVAAAAVYLFDMNLLKTLVSVSEPKDLKDCRTDQDTFTFWDKLRAAAAKKVGEVEAERFCKAFEKLHKKLVYEELDPETAKRYLLNS
ncbi:hypothetical protein DY000_02019174 [Brassica cretica]|uniref:Uncharacterized protein n=1 Tax=Brassica cretica TaxID=69181 RepID=A0ABQ7DB52_BRACR|nr:hypothetical protein DY000_02019174 [Brassica cretica]